VAANHPGRTFHVRNVHALERIELRSIQSAVAVNLGHDHAREIGRLVYLEQTARGDTWAVAEVDASRLEIYPARHAPGGPRTANTGASWSRGIATRSPASSSPCLTASAHWLGGEPTIQDPIALEQSS
jgi:hypothetical protein